MNNSATDTTVQVKQEVDGYAAVQQQQSSNRTRPTTNPNDIVFHSVIELSDTSSSSSDSDADLDTDSLIRNITNAATPAAETGNPNGENRILKKRKLADRNNVLSVPPEVEAVVPVPARTAAVSVIGKNFKQFWKAGDYEGSSANDWTINTGGIDHVRVHPKFLHSNATSHKWALGAFAELLDNSLDEICNGATYVHIDMLENKKDESRMLLVEDDGGGMDPDKMRHCMSLGYSAKSKVADTIGQYGNGFKTSTMRLGADAIVFSRSPEKDGKSPTQSIGLLSYTFLRSTGKEDIVVPMLDFEREGSEWKKIIRSSHGDWNKNLETIVEWSSFCSEEELLLQFNLMADHGTRIIIFNLWEDDQGLLELDFDADPHDIQLRGVNREEKNIQMAKEYPNSRHFLTYRHSLRSYASILYLRLPPGFRIILRGKDVEHHNIVNDMMLSEKITYKPQQGAEAISKDLNISAVVTIGFVKDARFHIDVQGFNVYHKNRLIKPFWRIWNAAGSDGRGVIGVLEANFVEPAHDKQGFERTTVLARLETRLVQMQKNYWGTYCHKIGYAPRRNKNQIASWIAETPQSKRSAAPPNSSSPISSSEKYNLRTKQKNNGKQSEMYHDISDDDLRSQPEKAANKYFGKYRSHNYMSGANGTETTPRAHPKRSEVNGTACTPSGFDMYTVDRLKQENLRLMERINQRESVIASQVLHELEEEKTKCKDYETQLQEAREKIQELNHEQETLIDIFAEERDRRDKEEKSLRKKLKEAANTIQELVEKVKRLESMKSPQHKSR